MKYFDFATGLTMTNESFNLFGKPVRNPKTDKLEEFHMDIASSIQEITEEIVLKLVNILKITKSKILFSWRRRLNCVANGKILKEKFLDIWIQPAAGDAGGSIGAALAYWYRELNKPRKIYVDQMKGSFLGPCYQNDEIENTLKNLNANFEKHSPEEVASITAKELARNSTVGWFQGRMEFGPRALGGRSILADPRSDKTQKELNLKIKFRESFRPFAPSILKEDLSDWFEMNSESPYMLLVAEVKKDKQVKMSEKEKKLFGIDKLNIKRSEIPAVTHVDYSARIQTVDKLTNPKYYNLINEFKNN